MTRALCRAAMSREHLIPVLGQQIRTRVRADTGVPLVLCSGIGASLEVLDPLVEHLNPDTTVVRFDVPALGLHPIHPYPMAFRIWPCCFDGFSTSWASSLENRSDARSCGDLVRERDEIIDSLGDGHAGGGAVARILLRAIQNALGDDGDLPQCQRVPES